MSNLKHRTVSSYAKVKWWWELWELDAEFTLLSSKLDASQSHELDKHRDKCRVAIGS